MAPVVDFENSIFHRQVLHAVFELGIELHATLVEILVVDTYRDNKVQELTVGHRLAPWHLVTSKKRSINIALIESRVVIGLIGQRHIFI